MLYSTPALDVDDRRVLEEIDRFYASFARATGGTATREWVGGIRKHLLAGAIRGSNSIEGYTVELGTATAIVDDAPVPAEVPEESKEAVSGYRDAMNWILQMPTMDFFAYSEMVLSALHFIILRYWRGRSPGRYRSRGIMVTGADPLTPAYVGPPAEEVPALMGELIEWLNRDEGGHPLVRAAMAHLNLVAIHPWRDGNGRMARALQTLVIARGGRTFPEFSSIEAWLGHDINTLAYYQVLEETSAGSYQPDRETHSWVRFCLRAHHQQAQVVERRLRLGAATWERVEGLVGRRKLNERVVPALYAAAIGQLRRETYQAEEGVTRDQAVRDIRRLERAGLLRAVNYGATLHYVAAGELKDIADEETAKVTSPAIEPYAR